jgi:protoheme IX farnesyltransferase
MKSSNSIAIAHPALIADYVKLLKPELTFLSVLTAIGSTYLAMRGTVHYQFLIHTFVGTTLVGGAAGVLNQYIERRYDGLMKRTERRPLPAGHVRPKSAFLFGVILALSGILYLFLSTNLVAGTLAILTLLVYLFLYTPLKRQTPFATVIGGIPGAIPPLIGWAIVRGTVSIEAWSLFFILFFWQMPHFLSLAWMYRKDYARAGYQLLVVSDPTGDITGRQILIYCCALVPASLMPTIIGFTGYIYFVGALLLSISFLSTGLLFLRKHSALAAQRVFYFSLIFLSLLFALLMLA